MKAVYKCRLCGKVFKYEITEKNIVSVIRQPEEKDFVFDFHGKKIFTKKYMLHTCGNGSFGYSEFCGIEEIGVEDE